MSGNPAGAPPPPFVYRFAPWSLGLFALLVVLVYWDFANAIQFMVGQWSLEEFSHGYLIPFISVFLVWQRRRKLQRCKFEGSWAGVVVVLLGLAFDILGRLSALFAVQHISLLIVLVGLVLSLGGWRVLRILTVPLAVLIFMVPLPNILLNSLSAALQLISSEFGVWLMRLMGVSVLLEGNVIDLGSYKLEVAEACSGLRYLLPLMTVAFLMACFFSAALWKKTLIVFSSIPITLVMNSLRIAAIGVMVDRWGIGMAEGLLHQVQGWMVFMLSIGLLLVEIMLLARVGADRRSWRERFGLELPEPLPRNIPRRGRVMPTTLFVASASMAVFGLVATLAPATSMRAPSRETFAGFPLRFSAWAGTREAMDPIYLDALKLDDYLLANYSGGGAVPVNLYVAWYDSQDAGGSTHSPRACLPGGGWRIVDLRQVTLPQVKRDDRTLRVNRVVIESGEQRQLVYYWFEQRGRLVTNEYLVKWYLLVDALLLHRSDGALIRLIVPLPSGAHEADGDGELQQFAASIAPDLSRYIPG